MSELADSASITVEAILAAAPDCIKVLSPGGMIRFINARGRALMEADGDQKLEGLYYPDLWPAAARSSVADAIAAAAHGENTRIEGYCPTLKGTPRWWETQFHAVTGTHGAGTDVIGVTRDISGRRVRELVSSANEERFAFLVEAVGDGICETDADGRFTFINSAGARMLGYRPEELIGMPLHDTLHPRRADGSACAVEHCPVTAALRTGQPVRVPDEIFWRRDGRAVPTRYSVYPIQSEHRHGGVVITFNDGTEQRQIERDLRRMATELSEADRRTTEFIATLAHELRNPLAPIRTGLQLMRKAGDDAATVGPVREMMERQVGQMVHLIGDLLDIARVTSGKVELKRERVEIRWVIEAALEATAALLSSASHKVDVQLPDEILHVDGDATRLVQIFTNLLNNAAKYTAAGGRIEIRAICKDAHVVVDVADSGIGIASDALSAIFEMFTRVGREIEGRQGGLGIGLNLVRRLVELHGGNVVAASDGLGKGSHFLVSLPLASPGSDPRVPVEAVRTDPMREPSRVKVLLVDDNVDAASSLALLLELGEHITKVTNSGAEALLLVEDFKPDVVFLDIGMPGMNGYEVARAIRKMPGGGNPVLVALTGWGSESDRSRSKNAGFDEHLTKPADISAIETLLARLDPPAT